jgi:hypothetical protein
MHKEILWARIILNRNTPQDITFTAKQKEYEAGVGQILHIHAEYIHIPSPTNLLKGFSDSEGDPFLNRNRTQKKSKKLNWFPLSMLIPSIFTADVIISVVLNKTAIITL